MEDAMHAMTEELARTRTADLYRSTPRPEVRRHRAPRWTLHRRSR
jgi:hypothetical protein